jgi:protein ImuB
MVAMERFICVYFYNLAYDALGDVSVDVVFDEGVVVGVAPRCTPMGIRIGDTSSKALTLYPKLKASTRSPKKEAELFEELKNLAKEVSPFATTKDSMEIFFPTRGLTRYYGDEEHAISYLSKLFTDNGLVRTVGQLPSLRVRAEKAYFSVGAAPGRFFAYLASLYGVFLKDEETRGFILSLPVRNVVKDQIADEVQEMGVKSVSDLLGVGRHHLSKRYGLYGASLYELLTGERDWSSQLLEGEVSWEVSVEFDGETTSESMLFALVGPVSDLLDSLENEGFVPSLILVQVCASWGSFTKEISSTHGVSKKSLMERINFHLDSMKKLSVKSLGDAAELGAQEIQEVTVRVKELSPLTSTQVSFDSMEVDNQDSVRRALDKVVSLAGEGAVLVPRIVGGRSPSDAARLVPFMGKSLDKVKDSVKDPLSCVPWPGSLFGAYPCCVYEDPIEISLFDANGALVLMNARGVLESDPFLAVTPSNLTLHISDFVGPWVVEERWWSRDRQRYGRILVHFEEDSTVHLLVRKNQRWLLEATYD